MKGKGYLKYIIVAVLAVLCGFCSYQFLQSQKIKVAVFNNDYVAGTQIAMDMFEEVEVSTDVINKYSKATDGKATYMTMDTLKSIVEAAEPGEDASEEDIALYNNKYLSVDVSAGSPILTNQLEAYSGVSESLNLEDPVNNVATTFESSNILGVTGQLKKNSHINIYVNYEAGALLDEGATEVEEDLNFSRTAVLLKNVRVLAVQSSDVDEEGNPIGIDAITVETSAQDALYLVDAASNGKLYCSLVNAEKYSDGTTNDVIHHGYKESDKESYSYLDGSSKSAKTEQTEETNETEKTEESTDTSEETE